MPSISVLTMSFAPAPPNTILMSLRLACSIAFSTPTAMSSSAAQTASICLKRVRKSCITLKASSRFQLPCLASSTLMSGWFFITALKASMRSLSIVVGMPRSATMLPLPFSALARYSAGTLPKAVLSPAT